VMWAKAQEMTKNNGQQNRLRSNSVLK